MAFLRYYFIVEITRISRNYYGRVLLGLLRYKNTQNRRYLCSFGSYSVFGMSGMSFRSVNSAPDSTMNRMEGMRFTRIKQNTRCFRKFLAGNPT